MTETGITHYFVLNHQNQPLELVLPHGSLMLAPRTQVEVRKEDLASPQVEALRNKRLLTIHKTIEVLQPEPPAVEASKQQATTAATKRRTSSKKEE